MTTTQRAVQESVGDAASVNDPDRCPQCGNEYSCRALTDTLDLERNSVTFDPIAAVILTRIYERGRATCEDLANWLESPDEWIAFSRLQRARLVYDAGTEFHASREGRELVEALLSEDAE